MLLDDWMSYSLRDFIPFEMSVYVNLFSRLNQELWPWVIFLPLVGLVAILLIAKQNFRYGFFLLGLSWLSCAYLFHYQLLNELNPMGFFLALVFALQGCLLLLYALFKGADNKVEKNQLNMGILIMSLSMCFFLALPLFFDRSWQSAEVFAIAPNPICGLTIGALMTHNRLRHWWLLLIPFAWVLLSLAVFFA